MAEKKKRVLVAGATGLVGGLCLKRLLAQDSFESVTAAGRRPLSPAPAAPGFSQVTVDFDDLGSSLPAADIVICALGSTMKKAGSKEAFYKVDFTCAHNLAKTARQNGASCFVLVSALGADPGAFSFYSRVKGELEEAVRRLGYESLVILRPSLILGDRAEHRAGEEIAKKLLPKFNFIIPKKYRPIEAETIAAALCAAALLEKPGVGVYESHLIAQLAAEGSGKGR